MNDVAPKPRSNFMLWLVLAACVTPFIASTAMFYFWPRDKRMNYGELITPHPLPELVLQDPDGRPVPLSALKGKWTLVQVDEGRCLTLCREKLYKMRQIRLAQGKNMDRVQRLWVVIHDDIPNPEVMAQHQGALVLRAGRHDAASFLPIGSSQLDHIWIVDPLGNVMMRYGRDADPSRIKNDLARLLRVSRID